MSLLSSALDSLRGVVNDVTSFYRQHTPEPIQSVAETAVTPFSMGVQGLYHGAVAPFTSLDQHLYSNYVAEPVTTALLAINPAYGNQRGAVDVLFGDLYGKGDSPQAIAAQQDAQRTSPGQAAQAVGGWTPLKGLWNDITHDPLHAGGYPIFRDPTTPEFQQQATETWFGQLTTGGADAYLGWYADPINIGGKVVTEATLPTRNIGKGTETITQTQARLADPEDVIHSTLQRWAETTSPSQLLSDPVVRRSQNSYGMAQALAGARTREEAATIYLASRGDKVAWERLAAEQPLAHEALVNAAGEVDKARALANSLGQPFDDTATVVRDLEAAQARDAWLSAALDPNNRLYGASGTYGVSRSRRLEALRASRADAAYRLRYGYSVEHYADNPLMSRAIRAVRWVGGNSQEGHIALSGPNLHSAPNELLAVLQKGKASPQWTEHWMDRFVNASNESDRLAVVEEIEDVLTRQAARDFGLSDDVAKDVVRLAQSKRTAAIDQFRANKFGLAEDGTAYKNPLAETQLANMVPMLDMAGMRREFKVLSIKKAADEGSLAAEFKMAGFHAFQFADTTLSAVNQLWKPAVLLLRPFAYAGRNVGESQIASMVQVRSIVGDPVHGLPNVFYNSWQRLKRLSVTAYSRDTKRLRTELTGVVDDYAKQVAWHTAERKSLADELADVQKQLDSHAARTAKLKTGVPSRARAAQIDDLEARRADIYENLNVHQESITNLEAAQEDLRKQLLGVEQRARFAERRTNAGPGEAFDQHSAYTDIARSLANSERPQQALQRGVASKRMQTSKWLRSTGRYSVKPGADNYYATLTHLANGQFRNSPWVVRLLNSEHPLDVADWLRTDKDGIAIAKRMGWAADDLDQQVLRMDDLLHRYVPDEQLQRMIAAGEVTEGQVAARLAGKELFPIHGEEATTVLGTGDRTVADYWNQLMEKSFHYIGTLPENNLARWPLYAKDYEIRRAALIDQNWHWLKDQPVGEQERFFKQVERAAHQYALAETNRTIYTITQRTNVADALRYVSPFLSVTMDRFGFYGRMTVENTDQMARLFWAYNAIPTETNSFGDQVVPVMLPGPVARILNLPEGAKLQFSKKSMNLVGQGEPWYNPGFGPPVTVPVAWLVRANADNQNWLTNFILPYGAGSSAADQVLPSSVRKWLNGRRDTDTWGNDFSMVAAWETYRYEAKLRADKPTMEEFAKRADALNLVKFLASTGSPVSVSIESPLAPQLDAYRAMKAADPQGADAQFLAQYPEFYDFMISLTKNPGNVNATQDAINRSKQYSGTLAALGTVDGDSSIAGLLTNDPSKSGFDQAAYVWEKNNPLYPGADNARTSVNVEDALRARQVSHGWQLFNQLDTQTDDLLARGGFTDIQQAGAEQIRALKTLGIEKIAREFPAWWDDYQTRDSGYYEKNARAFATILNDPRVLSDPVTAQWATGAKQYLQLRDWIVAQLIQRRNAGGSVTLKTKANADLWALYDIATRNMKAANPAWADVFTRYFENDNLLPDYARN